MEQVLSDLYDVQGMDPLSEQISKHIDTCKIGLGEMHEVIFPAYQIV